MQHRGKVLPGNRVIGTKQTRADVTRGDAVLIRPLHSGGVILARGHVVEVRGSAIAGGVGRGVARGVGVTVQDDEHLSTADLVLGTKVAGVGTRGVSRHEAGRRHVVEPALCDIPLVSRGVLVEIGLGGSKGVNLGRSRNDFELTEAQGKKLLGHCLLDLDRGAVEDLGRLVLLEEPQARVGRQIHLAGGILLRGRRVGGVGSAGRALGVGIGRRGCLLGNLDGICGSVGQEVHYAARPVGEGHLKLHELGLAHAQRLRGKVEHEEPAVGARRLKGHVAQCAPYGQHTLCRLRILILRGNSERDFVSQSGSGVARVGKVHKLSGGNRGNSVSLGVTGRLVCGVVLLGGLVSRATVTLGRLVRTGSSAVARGRRLVGADTCGIVRRCRSIRLGRLTRRRGGRLVGIARRRRIGLSRLPRVGGNNAIAGGRGLLGIARGVRGPRRRGIAVTFPLATVAGVGRLFPLIARSTRLGRIVGPGRTHTRYHAGQDKHARQHQYKQCIHRDSRASDLSHMGLRFPSEFAFATPSCVCNILAHERARRTLHSALCPRTAQLAPPGPQPLPLWGSRGLRASSTGTCC